MHHFISKILKSSKLVEITLEACQKKSQYLEDEIKKIVFEPFEKHTAVM